MTTNSNSAEAEQFASADCFSRLVRCSVCRGLGGDGGPNTCWQCHGGGQVERYRIIAYNPETKQDEDCGVIEARDWESAASYVRCTYNYPKRMIPVMANEIEFPSSANAPAQTPPDSGTKYHE